ncbi:hypothetical protein, partial [Geodermatophilus sp. CPCC 205761]|uniref:hypothetical protein n=1 Tax=Geodermatophilus sp. CPCC 205761 TaxID=2936597 RepID=UPI003EE9B2A9
SRRGRCGDTGTAGSCDPRAGRAGGARRDLAPAGVRRRLQQTVAATVGTAAARRGRVVAQIRVGEGGRRTVGAAASMRNRGGPPVRYVTA